MATGDRFWVGEGGEWCMDRPGSRNRLFGPLRSEVQMFCPHIWTFAKIGFVHHWRHRTPYNAPRVPTEPLVVHQVLAGTVHAVRDRFM